MFWLRCQSQSSEIFRQVPPIRGLTVKVPAPKKLSGLEPEPAFGIGGWLVGDGVQIAFGLWSASPTGMLLIFL
jgi:hypothetical protein